MALSSAMLAKALCEYNNQRRKNQSDSEFEKVIWKLFQEEYRVECDLGDKALIITSTTLAQDHKPIYERVYRLKIISD